MADTTASTAAANSFVGPGRSCLCWRDALVSNLRLLGFRDTSIHVTRDLFQRPNKRAFQAVVLFLFEALDEAEAGRRFEACRRCLDRRQEIDFAKVCCAWLGELAQEGRLPRVTPSLVSCPQGEKVYEVLTKLSTVVLRRRMLTDLDVFSRDLLSPPEPPPSGPNLARWAALAQQSLLSALASERAAALTSLSSLTREEDAHRTAVRCLANRYRAAGEAEASLEASLADFRCGGGVGGGGAVDAESLERLHALWLSLRGRVDALAPALGGLAAACEDGGERPVVDGATLAPQVPRLLQSRCPPGARPVFSRGRVDALGLVEAAGAGADAYGESAGAGRAGPRPEVEAAARDCLSCLQRQVGQLEELVDRAGSSLLPSMRTAVEDFRVRERSRRPGPAPADASTSVSSPFSLPGDAADVSSADPQRFAPPKAPSPTTGDVWERLRSARRLLDAERRRLEHHGDPRPNGDRASPGIHSLLSDASDGGRLSDLDGLRSPREKSYSRLLESPCAAERRTETGRLQTSGLEARDFDSLRSPREVVAGDSGRRFLDAHSNGERFQASQEKRTEVRRLQTSGLGAGDLDGLRSPRGTNHSRLLESPGSERLQTPRFGAGDFVSRFLDSPGNGLDFDSLRSPREKSLGRLQEKSHVRRLQTSQEIEAALDSLLSPHGRGRGTLDSSVDTGRSSDLDWRPLASPGNGEKSALHRLHTSDYGTGDLDSLRAPWGKASDRRRLRTPNEIEAALDSLLSPRGRASRSSRIESPGQVGLSCERSLGPGRPQLLEEVRANCDGRPGPEPEGMTARFRLSLDRLGLADSSDEDAMAPGCPVADLGLETSSILLSSSRSDLLDDDDFR